MQLRAPAILCASRAHGEHGAVVRLLTSDHGLQAAYVAGARGRQLRPLLIPGNRLEVEISGRAASRLPSARIELLESRGPWLGEPLPSAAIAWVCALTAAALPEGHPYPSLYAALGALLEAICHAPSARGWSRALAGYEGLLLRELGYGGRPETPEDDWGPILTALRRHGDAIETRLLGAGRLAGGRADVMAARSILLERLARIAGD